MMQRRGRNRLGLHAPEGHWLLQVFHPAGSLELAVARARRRNLAVSTAILILLAGSTTLLLISIRQALALARRQMDFVAGVSHELLTPLAAIRSAGQNLADGVVTEPERVARYGGMILREGDRLTDLVRRVLAMAGIESGGTAASFAPVAVGQLVEEALEAHQPALGAGSFTVETAIAPDLPEVIGDASALRRALDNLIGNAVKYGAEGRWLRIEAAALDGESVEIAVSDHGKGIAAADLPHVFERFYRGRDLAGSRIPGTGLGLALVKEIAEAHGGSVHAASTPGAVTRFTLRLPAVRKGPP
jgi:signal transduction histidine kinase